MFRPFLSVATEPKRLALAKLILLPIAMGYKLGMVSGRNARAAAIRLCLSGLPISVMESVSRNFVEKYVHDAVRKEALHRLDWHKAQGDKVVIVSGGLSSYLSHWCKHHQVELICSSLENKDGVLTGRYLGMECSGAEKARRIQENYDLAAFPLVYAYGDSKDDMAMLSLAHKRYYKWHEMTT